MQNETFTYFGGKVITDKEIGFKTYFARCLYGKHWVDSLILGRREFNNLGLVCPFLVRLAN